MTKPPVEKAYAPGKIGTPANFLGYRVTATGRIYRDPREAYAAAKR